MQIGAIPPVVPVPAVDPAQNGPTSGAKTPEPDPIKSGPLKPTPPLYPTIEDKIQISEALLALRWADAGG